MHARIVLFFKQFRIPLAAGPAAFFCVRISRNHLKPSIPGMLMSDTTKFGRLFLIASRPSNAFLANTMFAPKLHQPRGGEATATNRGSGEKVPVRAPRRTRVDASHELSGMSDIEDYPGPTRDHPEKKGQDGLGRSDENMVKPPARPENNHIDPNKKRGADRQGRRQGSSTG